MIGGAVMPDAAALGRSLRAASHAIVDNVVIGAAVHESGSGTKRRTDAMRQLGRYRSTSGHAQLPRRDWVGHLAAYACCTRPNRLEQLSTIAWLAARRDRPRAAASGMTAP